MVVSKDAMKKRDLKSEVNPAQEYQRRGSDSILQIIDKFHKIREERAKLNPIKPGNSRSMSTAPFSDVKTGQATDYLSNSGDKNKSPKRRTSSKARASVLKAEMNFDRRRQSMPCVFSPFDSSLRLLGKDVDNGTKQDPPSYKSYRRHSVSHAVYEYELAKVHDKKKQQLDFLKSRGLLSKRKPSKSDEELDTWLVGKDLHAYYNFWDRPEYANRRSPVTGKSKTPRPMPQAVTKLKDEETDVPRPRTFTM